MGNKEKLNKACPALERAALGTKIADIITLVNELRSKWVGESDVEVSSEEHTFASAVVTLVNEMKGIVNDTVAVSNGAKIAAAHSLCVVPIGSISATKALVAFIAPVACTMKSIKLANKNAIVQSAEDYWAVSVTNLGQAGADNRIVGAHSTLVAGGSAMQAYTPWTLGELSATEKVIAAGDVLLLALVKMGNAATLDDTSVFLEYSVTEVEDADEVVSDDLTELAAASIAFPAITAPAVAVLS